MDELISKAELFETIRDTYCINCPRRETRMDGKLREIESVVCKACDINDVIDLIEDIVSARQVEYCGKCSHYHQEFFVSGKVEYWCDMMFDTYKGRLLEVDEMDFCPWGEVKE